MQIKILGCSPIIHDANCYNASGYLVDNRILFDCGPGIWRALCQSSISASDLEAICISHFHVDHVSDLPALLMARYLTKSQDRKLNLYGPSGFLKWYKQLADLFGEWMEQPDLDIAELERSQQIGRYTLNTSPTPHTENSLCFRLTDREQRIFFYSGDTDYDETLISIMEKADLAFLECSSTSETKVDGHLTPGLAAELAAKARVKQLVLTHMYPEVASRNISSEISKHYKGKITIARDGLILDI